MTSSKTIHSETRLKQTAERIFRAGVAAVDPAACITKELTRDGNRLLACGKEFLLNRINRIFLVGIGKASCRMALAAENILGDLIHKGIVVTKYGHALPLSYCSVIEAGHPIPDASGVEGANRILKMVSTAQSDDLILCLISGGGSALVPAPVRGISLGAKQEATRLLMECGATIHEVNTIRKHLSRIKGGQLCSMANGAQMVSMILSDVVGDDLDMIASGITVPDTTSFKDCERILARYQLWDSLPKSVAAHIRNGLAGRAAETPKTGAPIFEPVHNFIVGNLSKALEAAAKEARSCGFPPMVLTSMIQGEASQAATVLCAVAKEVHKTGNPLPAPACILSGGETTVTLKGKGKGGRNMELALAAGIDLAGQEEVVFLSAGTDGTDGPTDATGAFASGTTVERGIASRMDAREFLGQNDAYHFFLQLNDLLITGPTQTNVMDLQILLIDEKGSV